MIEKQIDHTGMPGRILHVTGGMNTGGAETMLMHLYRKLDRNRLQFDFVSFTESRCHYDDEILSSGGRIFYVAPPQASNPIKFITDMINVIKLNGPYHAVHAHTLFNSGLALTAARFARVKKRVCHSHTMDNLSDKPARRLYYNLMKILIYFNANKNVACSKAAGEFLFGKESGMKQNFTILKNAIDLTPFKLIDQNDVRNIRSKFNIHEDTLLIGHVGNFGRHKNHSFLINLAETLKDRRVDFKLMLIGLGEEKKRIEEMTVEKGLTEYVLFLGLQTNIPLFMNAFDVFVFPSIHEGLGIALVEAQAAGTPCIISDTIPDECDMGLGLVKKLSLKEKKDSWVNAILNSSKKKGAPSGLLTEAILQKGYNLDFTVKSLFDIYELTGM